MPLCHLCELQCALDLEEHVFEIALNPPYFPVAQAKNTPALAAVATVALLTFLDSDCSMSLSLDVPCHICRAGRTCEGTAYYLLDREQRGHGPNDDVEKI
eukprot:6130433-Amphidinium_carterae.3